MKSGTELELHLGGGWNFEKEREKINTKTFSTTFKLLKHGASLHHYTMMNEYSKMHNKGRQSTMYLNKTMINALLWNRGKKRPLNKKWKNDEQEKETKQRF